MNSKNPFYWPWIILTGFTVGTIIYVAADLIIGPENVWRTASIAWATPLMSIAATMALTFGGEIDRYDREIEKILNG